MSELISHAPTSMARFSYADLPPEAERMVRSAAAAIKALTARFIPQIGQHLLAAKAALPHGAFTPWAETEVGISGRSARNYMAAAQWLDGKPETVADLPPTIIYALSGPTAPSEVVDEVVAVAVSGAPIDVAAVRARLDAVKVEQIELKIAQSRSGKKLTKADLRKCRQREIERYARERTEAEAEASSSHSRSRSPR